MMPRKNFNYATHILLRLSHKLMLTKRSFRRHLRKLNFLHYYTWHWWARLWTRQGHANWKRSCYWAQQYREHKDRKVQACCKQERLKEDVSPVWYCTKGGTEATKPRRESEQTGTPAGWVETSTVWCGLHRMSLDSWRRQRMSAWGHCRLLTIILKAHLGWELMCLWYRTIV